MLLLNECPVFNQTIIRRRMWHISIIIVHNEYRRDGVYCRRGKRLTPGRKAYYEGICRRKREEYIRRNRRRLLGSGLSSAEKGAPLSSLLSGVAHKSPPLSHRWDRIASASVLYAFSTAMAFPSFQQRFLRVYHKPGKKSIRQPARLGHPATAQFVGAGLHHVGRQAGDISAGL